MTGSAIKKLLDLEKLCQVSKQAWLAYELHLLHSSFDFQLVRASLSTVKGIFSYSASFSDDASQSAAMTRIVLMKKYK